MITEEVINKAIRHAIDTILSKDGYTIKADQRAIRKKTSYATVKIVTDVMTSWEDVEYGNSGNDLNTTRSSQSELLVSINFYRDGAIDSARLFRSGIVRDSIRRSLYEDGITIITRSNIRDVSIALEAGYEKRAQIDLTVQVLNIDVESENAILGVNIEGELQYGDKTLATTIEV